MIARVVNKGILCCRMISSKGPSGDGWLTVAERTSNVASVINDTDIADERERGASRPHYLSGLKIFL